MKSYITQGSLLLLKKECCMAKDSQKDPRNKNYLVMTHSEYNKSKLQYNELNIDEKEDKTIQKPSSKFPDVKVIKNYSFTLASIAKYREVMEGKSPNSVYIYSRVGQAPYAIICNKEISAKPNSTNENEKKLAQACGMLAVHLGNDYDIAITKDEYLELCNSGKTPKFLSRDIIFTKNGIKK